jgi:multidrug efflux pump subunit AcrA (membrane-fusion protein)
LVGLMVGCACPVAATAQAANPAPRGEMVLLESAAASRVVEKVRSGVPGVVVEVCVKVGDTVAKGQELGHTELDATKLQLDLAKHAMDAKANVEAAHGQAEAWTVTREETAEAVHQRKADKSRLKWALAMEKMYRGTYEMQLDAEAAQLIQYEYWKQQYEMRFFRAPVSGVVSEVLAEVGKPVSFASHLFTISNDNSYVVPVTVPAALAKAGVPQDRLAVRLADGGTVSQAAVESVMDNPLAPGGKIINLRVHALDFPVATRANLMGMKFEVLLPQVAKGPR